MNFDIHAPLDQTALSVALGFYPQLVTLDAGQFLKCLYLHWEVTGYNACDSAYNATVALDKSGSKWIATINTDPRLNATEPPQPGYAEHTYLRNGHAFGFAVAGMTEATPADFGPDPITLHEIETFCACAAAVAIKYGVDVADPALCMTHGEAAILDGYFPPDNPPCRWDLARLSPSDAPLSKAECVQTGNQLRQRTHQYKLELMKHVHG